MSYWNYTQGQIVTRQQHKYAVTSNGIQTNISSFLKVQFHSQLTLAHTGLSIQQDVLFYTKGHYAIYETRVDLFLSSSTEQGPT
jgi:hypothetical protein